MTATILQHRDPSLTTVPVIDLFAGPGGLGEGFSAYRGTLRFNVALSVEKDDAAHKTLELRSFVRQFPRDQIPPEYYAYVRDESVTREALFAAYPEQAAKARKIAWKTELGKEPDKSVFDRIDNALNGAPNWVLLGGPPCQAYSLMGRARMKNMETFATDHRHTLYREYLKIVAAFQPTIFVMENVKGILSSKHRDEKIFGRILADMRSPWDALPDDDRQLIPERPVHHGYRLFSFSKPVSSWDDELDPYDYLIQSERHGLPQRRHRVILLGIRNDYNIIPPTLNETTEEVTVADIIRSMPALRSRLSSNDRSGYWWRAAVRDVTGVCTGSFKKNLWGLGKVIRRELDRMSDSLQPGGRFVPSDGRPTKLSTWLTDADIGGVLQHETRSHMVSDLHRYFFCSCFAKKSGTSPKLNEFPAALMPAHVNAVVDEDGKVAKFADRFRVQLWTQASTTITSHIAKDGHYFIHPDPVQCRSLTVREAARLQTFPDNYFFEGNRTQQYHQVGNAVPPFLAYQLSNIVAKVIAQCAELDRQSHQQPDARCVGGLE